MSISQDIMVQDLPQRLRGRLEGQLRDGERLLWFGRPNAGRTAGNAAWRATVTNLFTFFVGGGMGAIGGLWTLVHPEVPVWPWVWWVAWGALSLAAFSVGLRTLAAHRRARRTVFAVTAERALECRALLLSPSSSHERAEVELVRVRTWRGGRGEIIFEPRWNDRGSRPFQPEVVRFDFLDDVAAARRAVEQMLGREIPEENFGRDAEERSSRSFTEGTDGLPPALRDRLDGELAEGERLLWLGQPSPGMMTLRAAFTTGCMFLAVATCGGVPVALAAVVGWIFPNAPGLGLAPWIMVPVVALVGLAAILGTLSAWYSSRRTAYVITDRRALVVQVGLAARVYSYGRTALHELQVRELEDGSGEIIFEEKVRVTQSESGSEERHTDVVGFIEVCRVEPARLALEQLLGRPVPALKVSSVSLNQHHPI